MNEGRQRSDSERFGPAARHAAVLLAGGALAAWAVRDLDLGPQLLDWVPLPFLAPILAVAALGIRFRRDFAVLLAVVYALALWSVLVDAVLLAWLVRQLVVPAPGSSARVSGA